ncbi:MAG: methionyl-tRNA formyltransferase [Sedimentisphaerales bacterium]|nr:methionyl-tRNA formyltransferase [Sedimentisphaerales bacterium]
MRIVFFGSGDFGCDTLAALTESGHEIAEVVTQPARPAGRGKKLLETPIAMKAQELGLNCRSCADVNTDEFVEHMAGLGPDVAVVIAFGQKIGPDLLNLPNCRFVNLHGSLLPAYRGAAPINWAIINGESEAGVTVIELNDAWDGGAMLGRSSLTIEPYETAGELHDRLAELGPQVILEVLSQIELGSDKPITQDETKASRAPKLRKENGKIDWSSDAVTIRNHIHGMWPWPGACCRLQQAEKDKIEKVTIARVSVVAEDDSLAAEPGAIGTVTEDLTVQCGRGRLRILELRPENSRLMNFADFVNGRRLRTGDRFLNG